MQRAYLNLRCNLHYRVISLAFFDEFSHRHADARQLSVFFEKSITFRMQSANQTFIDEKIHRKVFDETIESYFYELNAEKLSSTLLSKKAGFSDALLSFMHLDDAHALYIIQSIDQSYQDVCGWSYEAYDPFATFAYNVLKENFPFTVKETAANILRHVAISVRRFSAQRLIEALKADGLEPMIEEILDS